MYKKIKFILCICTYKRAQLLKKLLQDVAVQTQWPDAVIIVDGDPAVREVASLLAAMDLPSAWRLLYLPSNYANLSYQRYLGYKAAKNLNAQVLLYLDDDLRISQTDAIEKVVAPLKDEAGRVVGVTAPSRTGGFENIREAEALIDQDHQSRAGTPLLVKMFGAARRIPPGGLSPSGHRRFPLNQGDKYRPVEWLQGRVMAYSMQVLSEECFSEDLFALDHIRCGLGEDTFLSRKVWSKGQLLLAFCAQFEHPDDDLPKSYPYQAYKLGYASAYSRRLLNDHYRGFDPPLLSDRFALVKSYLGTACLNWWRAVTGPKRHRFAYAWGYSRGALRGLLQKPTARNLTPQINWRRDAEAALKNLVVVQHGQDS
ncbi:MAG: glycosyltransferase family 2 protein [Thermodesulfobacteriota bacterium]